MNRQASAVAVVAALLASSPAGTASGAKPDREQVVIGSVALPSRGVPMGQVEACDPRTPDSALDETRRAAPVENGATAYWFEVDTSTREQGFLLEVTAGLGDVDLDILFGSPAVTGYASAIEGGERGLVPPEADWAVVCMSDGLNASFRYSAGRSVPSVDVQEEASWSDHSANLRLLGRSFSPDSVRRMVFQGRLAITASTKGINIYRLLPRAPYIEHVSYLECASTAASDISVWGDYVFQSIPNEYPYFPAHVVTEYNRAQTKRCNNTDDSTTKAGIRIIDISDPQEPRQVKFIETPCGTMNHTLLPHRGSLYIYAPIPCDEDTEVRTPSVPPSPAPSPVPSRAPLVPGREIRPLSFQIRVIRFDPEDPRRSRAVGTPLLDEQIGCFDITVFPSRDLAACPQYLNDVMHTSLLDISDPLNPRVIKHLEVPTDSAWMAHATFSWDGRYLVVADTDGTEYVTDRVTDCEPGDKRGALWIYDVGDPAEATLVGHYALPRADASIDHPCAPSEVSMIPTEDPHQRVAVVGWHSGGMTVIDLSQPTAPEEIGHWLAPPASEIKGSYFYNGKIYSVEFWSGPGVRVFDLAGFGPGSTKSFATRMNPQTQLIEFHR